MSYTRKEVAEFYNSFTKYQNRVGVNSRIRTILKNLKKLKLKSNINILEVGCGVGLLSVQLKKIYSHANLFGTDISEGCIKEATQRAGDAKTQFLVTDMSDFNPTEKFDLVLFADVLEHIPVENHFAIFKKLSACTNKNCVVAINIPHPSYLEWQIKYQTEALQIIDQPLHLPLLIDSIYKNGFMIEQLSSYSLYHNLPNYQWIEIRKQFDIDDFKPLTSFEKKLMEIKTKLPF